MDYLTFKRLFEACFKQNGLEMYINEENIQSFFAGDTRNRVDLLRKGESKC